MGLDNDFPVTHFIKIILVHFQLAPISHHATRFFIFSNRIVNSSRINFLSPQRAIRPIRSLSHTLVNIIICFQVSRAEISLFFSLFMGFGDLMVRNF